MTPPQIAIALISIAVPAPKRRLVRAAPASALGDALLGIVARA